MNRDRLAFIISAGCVLVLAASPPSFAQTRLPSRLDAKQVLPGAATWTWSTPFGFTGSGTV